MLCVFVVFTDCSFLTWQGNNLLFGNICGNIKATRKREEIQKRKKGRMSKTSELFENFINCGLDSVKCKIQYANILKQFKKL